MEYDWNARVVWTRGRPRFWSGTRHGNVCRRRMGRVQEFRIALANVSASSARSTASGAAPLGKVVTGVAGVAVVSATTPFDVWPAADTGQARPVLARAHPLLDDGRIRVERIGRHLAYSSVEAQYWWKAPALSRIGAAVFIDGARTMTRPVPGAALGDVDVGAGLGFASLLVPGRIRVDFAHGLRDAADSVSVRYTTTAR